MSEAADNWAEIHAKFSSLCSNKNFHWKENLEPSATWQRELLCNTIQHPVSIRYPPPLPYAQSFLKFIITKLEKDGVEVIDEIYETYAELISKQDESREALGYKIYTVSTDNYLVLKESRNLVSNGTTGLCTWQAAQYFCEWINENANIFRDRVILELGSGVGLVGLLLGRLCQPTEVIFSDCHDEVIQCLIDNIECNISQTANGSLLLNSDSTEKESPILEVQSGMSRGDVVEKSVRYRNSKETVVTLDWEAVSDEFLVEMGSAVDIIVATDVVYDDCIIPALVRNLTVLLGQENSSGKGSKFALVCSAVRNPTTRDHFLQSCHASGLQYELKHDPVAKIFHYDRSTPIELVKLTKSAS